MVRDESLLSPVWGSILPTGTYLRGSGVFSRLDVNDSVGFLGIIGWFGTFGTCGILGLFGWFGFSGIFGVSGGATSGVTSGTKLTKEFQHDLQMDCTVQP